MDEIDFQTWICPTCFDDHPWLGHCTMRDDKGLFMPHPSDHSKIADEYRDRVAEIEKINEASKGLLDLLNAAAAYIEDHPANY